MSAGVLDERNGSKEETSGTGKEGGLDVLRAPGRAAAGSAGKVWEGPFPQGIHLCGFIEIKEIKMRVVLKDANWGCR